MSPQEMPAPAQGEAQQPAQSGGAATQLMSGIHVMLGKLQQLFESTDAIAPEEKDLLGQIVEQYGTLMESLKGGGQQPQAQGSVPPEAGAAKVKPAM